MKLIFTLALLLTAFTQALAQNCQYQLSLGNFTASVQDVAQVLPHTLTLTRPQNAPQGPCEFYRVYFAKGQANSYQRQAYSGGNALPYNLYRTVGLASVLKDFADAAAGEFILGHAPLTQQGYQNEFFVEVKSKHTLFSVPPGVYTDTLPINVYAVRTNGSIDYQASSWMTLAFTVPRYAELSIVPQNAPHDPNATVYVMDFGHMEPQMELMADLRIKANVPYGMRVTSQNGGALRKSPHTTQVPYQLKVGNGAFFTPPANSHWLGQEYSGSNLQGRTYPLTVRLGNFTQLDDGDYQDVLTFTVEAY